MRRVEELGFCQFAFETFPWGAGHYLRTGRAAPENLVELLRPFDAIYFGAHGDPGRVPDKIGSQQLMHPIRKGLDLDSLGETGAARQVQSAIDRTLAAGQVRTPDLGGAATTTEMTAAISAALGGG